jgi:hypothetical protein
VADLRERRSVVWDEALAAFVMQQAARDRAATRRSQCSRVGDVEGGLHGSSCVEKIASGEGRAPYARAFEVATGFPTNGCNPVAGTAKRLPHNLHDA